MNPGPFTLRELIWMADGRGKSEWAHTSLLATVVAGKVVYRAR